MDTVNKAPIKIPYLEAGDLKLQIVVEACSLNICRGGRGSWVTGSYEDPSGTTPLHLCCAIRFPSIADTLKIEAVQDSFLKVQAV